MIDLNEYEFQRWKQRHKALCDVLESEKINDEIIAFIYTSQRKVYEMIMCRGIALEHLQDAVDCLEELIEVDKLLHAISKKFISEGKLNRAGVISNYTIAELDNDLLKRGKIAIVACVRKEREKQGVRFTIPEIASSEVWQKLQHCYVPNICLWHLAFLIEPYSARGSVEKREIIMMDLYDAIQSGILKANTKPQRIPRMIDGGQTVDRWEIHINDFKEAIDSGNLKSYFAPYLKLWKSYLPKRTRAFGRLENPEPFLREKLEVMGSNGADFFKVLGSNLRKQKEAGTKDHSKAFQDAMQHVVEIDPEKYRVSDALDEYEREPQEAYALNNQSGCHQSGGEEQKNNGVVGKTKPKPYLLEVDKLTIKNKELFEDAYIAYWNHPDTKGLQPKKRLMFNMLEELIPQHGLENIYDEKERVTMIQREGERPLKWKYWRDVLFNKAFPKLK